MKKNIWVEKLGTFDLITLFIETLFSRASIRYDENKISGIALRLIDMLKAIRLCKNFHKAELTLNKKDSEGYALNYHMENDLNVCLDIFCDKYIKNESARFKSAVRLYAAAYLIYRSTFVTMVESEPEFKDAGIVNTIYLRRNPLNSLLIPYYAGKGHTIRESILSSECLAQYLKPCYRLWTIIAAKLSTKKARSSIKNPKPSIWVEYAHRAEVHYPFWRESIDENAFDIVYYLDRNDYISLDEQIEEIENKQLKWIDLHFDSLVKMARIGLGDIIDMGRAFFSCPSKIPFWFRVFRFELRMWHLLYEPVFRRFKVKVLIQHQECLWTQEPQLAALEAAGGIMVGFHWSNFFYYKVALWSHPQHVYFVWSKMAHELIKKGGDICRYVLPSGAWLTPQKEKQCNGLKDDLSFVIAILDSSVAYNVFQSKTSLDEFYLKTLKLLEDNQTWGGIVKSKNWSLISDLEFLPHGKEIVLRATSLMKQKRLSFLDNTFSPIAASACADISVCYGLNSAGIISSLRGYRAIHWDCSGWLNNPFYRDEGQRFIYSTLDGLEDAVVKAYHGDAGIGDFSGWKQRLNHFNDESGPARVGKFINDYMTEVTNTDDAAGSLERTVKRYRESNNIDDSFFKLENIWEDEKICKI